MLKSCCGSQQSIDQRAQLCQADVLVSVPGLEKFGYVAVSDIYSLENLACSSSLLFLINQHL
jgi:hypothetical protein